MNSKLGSMKGVVWFLLITGILISCKKDPVITPGEKVLTVLLTDDVLNIDAVDSADVVLKRAGSQNPIYQRLVKGTANLRTSIDGLSQGNWTAEITLYTKKYPNGKSFQYLAEKSFTVTGTSGTVTVTGPPAQGGNGWKQRLVLSTSLNEVVILVPVDVTDPYFEIRTATTGEFNFFHIERTAYDGNAVIALKQWACDQNCPGDDRLIYDQEYFQPFTNKIKTTPWSQNEIIITIGNLDTNHFYEFSHTWNN